MMEYLPNGLQLLQVEGQQKLGQDAILLSYFAAPRKFARVLDLGCGTGAVALGLYRPGLHLFGLDLQAQAVDAFRESVRINNLEGKFDIFEGDLRNIRDYFAHGSMDYAVCNPPYFSQASGKVSPESGRAIARTETEVSIEQVALALAYVLKTGGKCALVFRPERLAELCNAMCRVRLVPKRARFVHQNYRKKPSVVLLEFRKGASGGITIEPPLLIENEDGSYSEEYNMIYNRKNIQ